MSANTFPDPNDPRLMEEIVARQAGPPIRLELPAANAFLLLSALQLALRHPSLPVQTAGFLNELARGLQERIGGGPALAALMEAGWDSRQDVPADAAIPEIAYKPGELREIFAVVIETPRGEELLRHVDGQEFVTERISETLAYRELLPGWAEMVGHPLRLVRFGLREVIEEALP